MKAVELSMDVDIRLEPTRELSTARPTLEDLEVGLEVPPRLVGVAELLEVESRSSAELIFSKSARAVLNRAW